MRDTHVFISYKREDAALASRLRLVLRTLGFQVWWDEKLQTGGKWAEEIDDALRSAYAVFVLWWSEAASHSDWVKHEASIAKSRGVLVQAKIAECDLPPTFSPLHAANLRNWTLDEKDPAIEALVPLLRRLRLRRYLRALTAHAIAVTFLGICLVCALWYVNRLPYVPDRRTITYLDCLGSPATFTFGREAFNESETNETRTPPQVIRYLAHDNTCWTAVRRWRSFVHAPGGDLSSPRVRMSSILNYLSPAGQPRLATLTLVPSANLLQEEKAE